MKKRTSYATGLCFVLGSLAACVGEVPINPPSDRGPATEPETQPPAGKPPANVSYPEGPYGAIEGERVTNHVFQGFADDDRDSHAANDPAREFALKEYFQGFDPNARVIMMNVSALWCAPCQVEATHMRAAHEKYGGRGARIFTVLLADMNRARSWAELYDLPTPVLADPMHETQIYLEATPLNLFVDARSMTILAKVYSEDYESILEHYLETLQ